MFNQLVRVVDINSLDSLVELLVKAVAALRGIRVKDALEEALRL